MADYQAGDAEDIVVPLEIRIASLTERLGAVKSSLETLADQVSSVSSLVDQVLSLLERREKCVEERQQQRGDCPRRPLDERLMSPVGGQRRRNRR